MKSVKKLPFYIRGIIVVALAAGLVLAVTAGLRLLENGQQKPRVLKAVAALAAGLGDEKYSLNKPYELLRGGRLSCSGKVSVKNIEEGLLEERYRFLLPYLKNTSLDYTIRRDEAERLADFRIKAALYGVLPIEIGGYFDEEECILHIPGFHEDYLAFSPDNMKLQYESSLLYTVLGDRFSLPEEDLADYVFFDIGKEPGEKKKDWKESLEETLKLAGELYKEISVEKTKRKEDILWNGSYESCTLYDVTVPLELVNNFLHRLLPPDSGYDIAFEEENIPIEIALGSGKQLLKLGVHGTLSVNQDKFPVSMVFYPKGVENPWDSVLLTLELTWEEETYGFQLVGSNEFLEGSRVCHASLSMTHPYVAGLADIDMKLDTETGDIFLDFALKTPMITMDGVLDLSELKGEVKKPEEEPVRVFELGFFEILRFTRGLNWDFFKKQ